MSTVLLSTAGTYGDIAPILSLARELRARGVRPLLLVNPAERHHIEREKLEARYVGEELHIGALIREKPQYMGLRGGELVIRELFVKFARQMYPVAREAIRECAPACVVSHLGCFGSTWAAWAENVPTVTIHLAPVGWFSPSSLNDYPWWQRIPIRSLFPLILRKVDAMLRPAATEAGISSCRGLLRKTFQNADLILGLWSPLFRRAYDKDPAGSRICGFPRPPDANDPLPEELDSFLSAGEPPIAFGLGTSAVHAAGRFFEKAAEACDRLNRRGVFFHAANPVPSADGRIFSVPYAPYDKVFPRCATVVHHGGIGTTAAVLRAGGGCVTVPFAHDQFENAMHLSRLGLARSCFRYTLSAKGLSCALREVLSESVQERARSVAEGLAREEDGAAVAAEAIVKKFISGR